MKLSIEQHELRALVKNIDEMLPFVDTKNCEKAIQTLFSILEDAVEAKEELDNQHNIMEGRKGKDLLEAIWERRKSKMEEIVIPKEKEELYDVIEVEKQTKKRPREVDEVPLNSYDTKLYPQIIEICEFAKQGQEYGFVLCARPNWNTEKFYFFANSKSLKFIDGLSASQKKKVIAILKRDVCKMKKGPALTLFLQDSGEWGKKLLKSF